MQTDPPIQELLDFVGSELMDETCKHTDLVELQFDVLLPEIGKIDMEKLHDPRASTYEKTWVRADKKNHLFEFYISAPAWELYFMLQAIRKYNPLPIEPNLRVGGAGGPARHYGAGGGASASSVSGIGYASNSSVGPLSFGGPTKSQVDNRTPVSQEQHRQLSHRVSALESLRLKSPKKRKGFGFFS